MQRRSLSDTGLWSMYVMWTHLAVNFEYQRFTITTHSLVKYISAIVASLPDDRVARGGEHVQLGHLGEHLENIRLLERVVGDVQHGERLAPLQLLDVLAGLQLVPELVRSHDLCQLVVVLTLKH